MPMRNMSVLHAKRFGVYTIHPGETLKSAAIQMQHHNISALIVIDEGGFLAGVITRTDLVHACFEQSDWYQFLVSDYMATDVVTVELDDPLLRVMELLINRHIHRVVAVDHKEGKLMPVAVLSAADVVYHMAHDK